MTPKITIIILNWNKWKDTTECLRSVLRITYPNFEIILIDNGSTNSSVKELTDFLLRIRPPSRSSLGVATPFKQDKQSYAVRDGVVFDDNVLISGRGTPKHIVLIKNPKNFGYSKGNNIAIEYALQKFGPEYILLLNNDVVVDEAFLDELVANGESDKTVGVLGPKIYYYDYNGRKDVINFAGEDIIIWRPYGVPYGHREVDRGQHNNKRYVDKVEGSCILIKKDVFNRIGFLYPEFFLYYEETDFCFRAKKNGFKILYVPNAKVWHKVSASSGSPLGATKLYYTTRNLFLFINRNATGLEKGKFLGYFFWYRFINRSISLLIKHKNALAFYSFIRGVKAGVFLMHEQNANALKH